MPISKTTGYRASDGAVYATVEEAQLAEIRSIVSRDVERSPVEARANIPIEHVAQLIYDWRNELIEALTTGPRSRPRARKAAGTTNPRRAVRAKPAERERATPEAAGAAFKEMHAAVDAA